MGPDGPRLFAGIDVSTQSCKLVVIDLDATDVVHVDRVIYDEDLSHYGTRDGVIADAPDGVSESDPAMWVEAIEIVLGRLESSDLDREAIRAIALSGQQHGLVAVDEDGGLARPTSKLWNDFSTAEECAILTEMVGGPDAMIAEVSNSQRPGYTAGKILHMRRHEPEVYARTATFFVVKDYLNWVLTGGAGDGVRILEPGDASGTALWNPATGEWSTRLVDGIAPDLADKLPPVGRSDALIGRLSGALAARFGLSPECMVAPGSGDNMCAAIGTGNVTEGVVTVSLGTSGTACTFRHDPFVDPKGEIASYRDATGGYLPLLCVSNLANGYNEILRLHGLSHADFGEIVGEVPPGNLGRLLVPWYGGERTPDVPNGAPIYFGFDLDSLELGPLCRAVLEGHVLNLHAGFGGMPVDLGRDVTEVRLTGGLSRSPVWCQTIADVFDTDAIPVEGEGAALGAAISAAWVWTGAMEGTPGERPAIEELVERFVRLDEGGRCSPRPQHRDTYAHLRTLFAAVSRRARGLDAPDPFEVRAAIMGTGVP
jgi:xylulokinase